MDNPLQALIADFVITEKSFTSLAAVTPVAAPDATRWSIIFALPSTAVSVNISTLNTVSTTSGMAIATAAGQIAYNFRDYGPVVCQGWFAIQQGAGAKLTVIETFYRPPGWEESGPDLLYELAERYAKAKWPLGK